MKRECKEHLQRISEYLDGELDSSICRQVEEHLAACPECRDCLESLRRTIQLCKEAAQQDIPPQAREHLRAVLREHLAGRGQ